MANQEKKVSIIIPTFNVEEYIEETIASVKLQTYHNIEVIVIDDGSTDGTVKLIKELTADDSRFHLKVTQNHGPGHARNQAIEFISGDYVLFLDSDDYLAKESVSVLLMTALKNQVKLVLGKTKRVDASKVWDVPSHKKHQLNQLGVKTISKNPELLFAIGPGAKLYDVSLVRDNFFSETRGFAEDQLFVLQAYLKAGDVFVIPDVVYYYRVRGSESQSLTQSYRGAPAENLANILSLIKDSYDLLALSGLPKEQADIILQSYYNRLCEIELRVLFKANLLADESRQIAYYQLLLDFQGEEGQLVEIFLKTANFGYFILTEQLELFFLVKKKTLPSYYTWLKQVDNQGDFDSQITAGMKHVLKTQHNHLSRNLLRGVTFVRYGIKRVSRRMT